MPIPEQAQKTAILGSVVLILFWIGFFIYRATHHRHSQPPPYTTQNVDGAVAEVAAQEAQRITAGKAKAVLLLTAREKTKGTPLEQRTQALLEGFQRGLCNEQGQPSADAQILAKKYRLDDPNAPPLTLNFPWPPLLLLQDIRRENPTCNVIVSFCGMPAVNAGDSGRFDPGAMPRLIVVDSTGTGPNQWPALFNTQLVEILFSAHSLTAGPPAHSTREAIESQYYIVTKDNLAEMLHKAGGK